MKPTATAALVAMLVLGVAGLGQSAGIKNNTDPKAIPDSQKSDSSMGTMPGSDTTMLNGTVQSVQKQDDGSTSIQVQDSIGVTETYMVSKNTEVRDAADKRVAVSKVKKGSSVTLSLQNGQVTKISLNS